MDEFLTSIKSKYSNRPSSHGQKLYPPHYSSSEPVKLEVVIKKREHTELTSKRGEHEPTSTCPDHQLVPYSDIFKKKEEQVARKVLIEGGAGIGKTTFCLSISKDWANEELFQRFKVLLLLPLHEKRIAATSSLAELIETLQESENLSASIVASIEKTKGEGVLIVADGWDKLNAQECSKSFLYNVLSGHVLDLASIIVTSRPSHSDLLCKSGYFDRLLTIRGFGDKSIRQYIRLDFADSEQKSDYLLKTVDSNPLIKHVCRIPLNCASLCHLWRTESQKGRLLITMTELCTKMIWNVVLYSIKKADKYEFQNISHLPIVERLPEELKSSWRELCWLAFQTIHKSQEINLSQSKSNMLVKFGLVEIVNKAKCDFLRPAFQEYLAALHVANQCCSPDTHMQDQWIRSLGKQVTDFWRFLFGICGQSGRNLALLEHAIQLLSKFNYLRCLICHCAFEAKNAMIDKKAIEALSTPSGSKHFGDPKTNHDCEAILYVIKQMRSVESDVKVELNFKDCNFTEQQLYDLAKMLTEDNEIEVISLDLSNKFNLPNKKVADLFNKANKALTAFQTLEKLSLRNNKIGKKIGNASYTMKAVRFLKCLTQLDLSFNRLTLPGLKALQDTVEYGSLAQLEILLLQGSLSYDANENIQFLKTFAPCLLRHCRKLQELDISINDLGEPGSPFVCALVDTLTGLNLHVNKEYESEVDKNFIRTMEDLIRRKEEIGHTVVHGVIVGPGRSGKNSLMDRLMGKGPLNPNTISPSTGVLDSVVKVEVKKLCTMDAAATNLKWTKLEYDQEALELMMITIATHIASLAGKERKLESIPDLITQLDEPVNIASAVILVENESENDGESGNETESEMEIDGDQEEIAAPEVAKGAIIHPHNETEVHVSSSETPKISYSKEFSLREGPMDIFKRAVKLRRMHALREHLESKWSLYLTNTGGQLEFQELMPLLVCGPSVFFVTIPLNIDLHKPYTVRYQYPNGDEKTYLSSFTLMDEILQTLATIAALDCTGPQLEEADHKPIKPKVFFIGTHKDQLPKSSADDKIQEIDEQLQDIVKQTSLKQDSIHYAEGSDQLMFTVNNLDKDDYDFQKIRSALQRMVERQKEFTIPCPCSWLVFSLVLREKHKSSRVLSYYECFTVAKSCGISSQEDFNKALLFIHHKLGLIRYFPVKGLNDRVIIDPHLMFDTITKLIVETFISDHASEREIEDLQKRGIFSIEAMRTISLKNYSDSQLPFKWTLDLLKHLGIAVPFKDKKKYFFPSVLCHAPDDEKQGSNVSDCSIKLPPPISIAFKGGFCPRGIPGILIKSLMNNEIKSSISWELHQQRVFRNQVSFSVGPVDIILKIRPTHIEICFDVEFDQSLSEHEVNVTCEEAYEQIKRVMSNIIVKLCECDYYFTFNCTRSECKEHPHPAKIDWDILKLECRIPERKSHLPDGYELWTQIGAYQRVLGNQVLDSNNNGVSRHLGQIADKMCEWEGPIAEKLGLTLADVAAINTKHRDNLQLQTREALEKWKQKLGPDATYNNLIKVFKQAGYEIYAEFVEDLVKNGQADTGDSNRNITPPPPSKEWLSPVFPSESGQYSESSSYAAASGVKLLQEDYQLESNPGSNTRLKVKELYCDDDSSSMSQSIDNEVSYMEVEHQGVVESCDYELSKQSGAESVAAMKDSVDLNDKSTMESAQERSNPVHQDVLKRSNENETEAQSESELKKEALSNKQSGSMEREVGSLKRSKLEGGDPSNNTSLKRIELRGEAPSDNKLSGSMVRGDNSLKRSKLGGETPSDKPTGSMESDDVSLKQSKLEDLAPSYNKRFGSMEREDDSLKLGGETHPDNKQSSLLERHTDSLKQGNQEAGQSTTIKRSHSNLDSTLSKRMKKITPLDKKGEQFAVDLCLLMKLCGKIASQWRSIGIQLGVPDHELDDIQGNSSLDPHMVQNCLNRVFDWWLKNEQDIIRLPEKLAQAIHMIGEHEVEVEIKQKFGLSLNPCFDINYGLRLDESELPAHVRKYCHDTKKRYIQQTVLPELDWPPTLGGEYIRLALVKQGRTTRDFKYHTVVALQKDYVRGNYDNILQHKTEIGLEEIFDPIFCQGGYEVPLKMLIDGAPGVGKTTLSRNVSRKWAKGEFLQEYWLVLLLHLRERGISRAQTIDNFFYHDDQVIQDAVATLVKEISGRGVLLIFDGFDELSLTQRHEQSLFLDIIEGKILNKCSIVITSRPYASRPVQELQSVDRHVEVLGFTNEQIHECVKQRISDRAKAEELCDELENRLDIASICQIPLNCSIVLYTYEMEEYRLPDTLTELYELFILHSLRRYTTRTQSADAAERLCDLRKLPSPIKDHFDILSKLAYSSLKEDKLVFEREELEQALSLVFSTDIPMLDLMTSAKSYSSRGTHDTYSFLHLTIQEYLGAFWAANNLSDKNKLDFLKENMKEERLCFILWFFAGITKLDISNVCSIFNNDLWEYDNHIHICHLLYESDSKNHSLCGYVAKNCVANKEISFVKKIFLGTYEQRYSRFDLLMITHFLAHSQCQWNRLTLLLDNVKIFHKVFNGLNVCGTSILQIIIKIGENDVASFHEGIISMLDEIPQFRSVTLFFELTDGDKVNFPSIKGNIKNALMKTKAIKSIHVNITGRGKDKVTRNFYDELIEGIAHNGSLVQDLKLLSVSVQGIEYLMSLLIKWNSNLKFVNLSIFKDTSPQSCEEMRCFEFCRSLSTFLSKSSSLRQLIISPPFADNCLVTYIDTIQSALDQNSTLEILNIRKKIVFQRNKHTSKLEIVKGHEFLHSYSQADQSEEGDACHHRMPSGNSDSLCTVSDSESDDDDDDVESFQVSLAKRQKVGTSSACQATLVHVQPELNPQQSQPSITMAAFSSCQLPALTHSPSCPSLSQCATVCLSTSSPMGLRPPTMIRNQPYPMPYQQQSHVQPEPELYPHQPQPPMAVFSSSQMSTLTHSPSCPSLFLSQCTTVSPRLQPNYSMTGSSSTHGTHHSLSRNHQTLSHEQNDQNQSGSITSIQLPHRVGSTNALTVSPMGSRPPTMARNQSYPMPYQQQSHVQPELYPRQPQPPIAAFSSSQLPVLSHSPSYPSLYLSRCATVSPQLQPNNNCMAGSSSTQGIYHSLQTLSQEQNDHQNQSENIIRTQLLHMGLIPPTLPYPMAYQLPSHEVFPQYHINPSFNYHTMPHHAPFPTGMNPPRNILPAISPYLFAPAQTWVMPPANLPPMAGHALQHITSEPEQYCPATAPPIHNPSTEGASSTTSTGHLPSPLPTTSTST